MKLIEFYRSLKADGNVGDDARALLEQTHWFTVNAVFDPKTGKALPQALSAFLAKVSRQETGDICQDRLWRITDHARRSVERLFRSLNESPRREHAFLPVRAVRELDANSFIKLSNRPGRNIREKLAGKPYLQAVRRFQSVDLPENRLLKAFVIRLAELLKLRQDCLGEREDELLPRIQSWLRADETQDIARWENLPPNNTLLSHRDYRRVWDAWRWLQRLDDDIAGDYSRLEERRKTMLRWQEYGRMYRDENYLFAEMPVIFDYETFGIRSWVSPPVFRKATHGIDRSTDTEEFTQPVCIDLSVLHPYYALRDDNGAITTANLRDTYLWQQWNGDRPVVLELFRADAAYLHPDAVSVSSTDLFFSKQHTKECLSSAAQAIASHLRDVFKNNSFIWLVPDYFNYFELPITRRSLNARFPGAEPLPRSVAAVFEQVDYSKIVGDGYSVVVVDTIGGKTCATKLIARFNGELLKRLPQTRGFYWERCPPVILSHENEDFDKEPMCRCDGIMTVDEQDRWHDPSLPAQMPFVDQYKLKKDERIGSLDFCINLAESPVVGGIRLKELQGRASDIPLWRDHIPELSMKVMKDGRYQRFSLVGKNTTVRPIRGVAVPIKVFDIFTLPAGRPHYQLPLYQGENADELGFSARLDSPAFPLEENTECELNLTFTYGEDEPYCLVFAPLDKSFPPVRAAWRRTEEEIVNGPKYPTPMTWEDLKYWTDPQRQEVDLLEWLIDSLTGLKERIPKRTELIISSHWRSKTDENNDLYWYTFARTEQGNCYCNSRNIVDSFGPDPNVDYPVGAKLFCIVAGKKASKLSAVEISKNAKIALTEEAIWRLVSFRERSLQNRMCTIWADARSLIDEHCPGRFKTGFCELMATLLDELPPEIIERKMLFLLACLHKDTTEECVRWITDQVESGNIYDPRSVGLALGDVSENWQKYLFDILVSKPNKSTIPVFAYSIWREPRFVERFSIAQLQGILNTLRHCLANIKPLKRREDAKRDKRTVYNWVRATAEPLELLLGLLRTRNSEDPEIKMILQPRQKITTELAKQVERITEMVAESRTGIYSRVQLNLEKPEGDRTPDLLFALRLYLTGDDGANAIHITGVSDND